MPDCVSLGAAGVERDAADQVDGAQQLVVGHGVLRRLIRIGRGGRCRRRLVVLFLVGRLRLVAGLQLGSLVVGLLVVGLLVGGIGDRPAQVLLAEARALLDGLDLGL